MNMTDSSVQSLIALVQDSQEQTEARFDQILEITGRTEAKVDVANEKVHEVDKKAGYTNGKIAAAMKDIVQLQLDLEAAKKDVATINRERTGMKSVGKFATIVLLPIALGIMGVTLLKVWDTPTITPDELTNAVQTGLSQDLANYEISNIK